MTSKKYVYHHFVDESFHHRNHHHQGLAHQPNSLDDLDNDTIPFDNVPVRYDDSGKISALENKQKYNILIMLFAITISEK